jgi:hypothetical protein
VPGEGRPACPESLGGGNSGPGFRSLEDELEPVQEEAAIALKRIDPEAAAKATLK